MIARSRLLSLRFLFATAAALVAGPATAGVMLTAEVYDTPGMPGYQTYDLTASSPVGFVNGFSFLRGDGVVGPVHQGPVSGSDDPWGGDRLFGPLDDSMDSRWLVAPDDGLQIGGSQSADGLHLAYTFVGENNYRHRNLPILRLTTNDPSAVRITGDFDIGLKWDDGTFGDSQKHRVETRLSDIAVGSATAYSGLPAVPTEVLAGREAEYQRQVELSARLNAEQRARHAAQKESQRQDRLRGLVYEAVTVSQSHAGTMGQLYRQHAHLAGQVEDRIEGAHLLPAGLVRDTRLEELVAMRDQLASFDPQAEFVDRPMPTDSREFYSRLLAGESLDELAPIPVEETTPPIPIQPIEPPTVTVGEYQSGLDQEAERIRLQIEQLQGQLNEVTERRSASESPGFEVPAQATPSRLWSIALGHLTEQPIAPIYSLSSELVTTVAYNPLRFTTFQSGALIDIASPRSLLTDVVYDGDASSLNTIRQLTLSTSTSATPEPGSAVLVLIAALSAIRRR